MSDTGFPKGARPTCSVDGCDKNVIARGWCHMHYARWRKYGTTKPWSGICEVDGCAQISRSRTNRHCEMHYYRLRRTGSTADPVRVSGPCRAAGCDSEADRLDGLCRMHYLRVDKRNDLDFVYQGPANHMWTGDEATYRAVHQRVKKQRGRPSTHRCVDCGKRAQHWSYDRSDPDQKYQEGKGPYSTDISRYHPRCVSCHKKFDMVHVLRERASS